MAMFLIEFISNFKAGKCTLNYQHTNNNIIVVKISIKKALTIKIMRA
jgi:hypothetical protein